MLLTEIGTLDELLHAHATAIGHDFVAYRNHAYRVANLCLTLAPDQPERVEKIAVASAFHDMGIWTDGTFDYLGAAKAGARSLRRVAQRRLSQAPGPVDASPLAVASVESAADAAAVNLVMPEAA